MPPPSVSNIDVLFGVWVLCARIMKEPNCPFGGLKSPTGQRVCLFSAVPCTAIPLPRL